MHRLRHALSVGVVAFAAATLVQGASAAGPTALTGSVSAVAGTSATVNGTVNPGGAATDWWFEYGTATSYGAKTSSTPAGSGSANVSVSKSLTGLSPATTYHYRLVAKNSTATANGGDGLFTTASPPVVVTSAASGVGPSAATLGGTVNPNGQATTWYVEYGTSTSYGTKTASADAGSGSSAKSVSIGVGGLTAGRTYHFRLVATSSAGTAHGDDRTFVTAEPPGVTTSAASSIGSSGAGPERQGRPEWALDDLSLRIRHDDVVRGEDVVLGRRLRHERHECLEERERPHGRHHIPLPPRRDERRRYRRRERPELHDAEPTDRRDRSGNGDRPDLCDARRQRQPQRALDDLVRRVRDERVLRLRTSAARAGSGTSALAVMVVAPNLTPGLTYHFRVVATSSLGTSRGADATFATTGAPAVATGPVTFTTLTLTSARVNGTVNPHGLTTTWWFEYGRTPSYGFRTTELTLEGSTDVSVATRLVALTPGVRWHYHLVARSSAGTTVGADASFATPPRPLDPSGRPFAARSSAPRRPMSSAAPAAATSSAGWEATTSSSEAGATT